jgi:hypothetical protein
MGTSRRRYQNPAWNEGPDDLSDFDNLTAEDMEADERPPPATLTPHAIIAGDLAVEEASPPKSHIRAQSDLDLTKPFKAEIRDEDNDPKAEIVAEVSWDPRWPTSVNVEHLSEYLLYTGPKAARAYADALVECARRVELHQARQEA